MIIIVVVPVAQVFFGMSGQRENSIYDLQTKDQKQYGRTKML